MNEQELWQDWLKSEDGRDCWEAILEITEKMGTVHVPGNADEVPMALARMAFAGGFAQAAQAKRMESSN